MDHHEMRQHIRRTARLEQMREALHAAKRRRAQWCAALVAYCLVCLLVILWAGQCFGATVPLTVYPSCPRVVHHLGNKTMPCSGVLIWKSESRDLAQVVTTAHLFTEGVGAVKVACADGKTYNALVVHIDRPRDFAILHIRRPLCRVVRFAARLPVVGARLLLGGYPHGGRFRWHGGLLGRWDRNGWFAVRVSSQQGDSGGPILNEKNELVGLISATRPGETIAPGVAAIAAAAADHRPKADFLPAGLAARPRQGYLTSAAPPDT
jgi:S1-C subfamily serine protease